MSILNDLPATRSGPTRLNNRLLDELPPEDLARLAHRLQRVRAGSGDLICERGEAMRFVHFPVSGMLSSVVVMSDGAAIEATTIGIEGTTAVALLANEFVSPCRVVQQVPGESLRLSARDLRAALDESAALRRLVERYALTLLQHTSQNVACNLRHSVEQRLCRWLLTTADRTGVDRFDITQEFLSEMLGVRRQTVSQTAAELQRRGLIAYRRGDVRVIDRPGLERAACECYAVTTRVFGDRPPG